MFSRMPYAFDTHLHDKCYMDLLVYFLMLPLIYLSALRAEPATVPFLCEPFYLKVSPMPPAPFTLFFCLLDVFWFLCWFFCWFAGVWMLFRCHVFFKPRWFWRGCCQFWCPKHVIWHACCVQFGTLGHHRAIQGDLGIQEGRPWCSKLGWRKAFPGVIGVAFGKR